MNYFEDEEEFGYEYDIHNRIGLEGELDQPASDDPRDPYQRFATFVKAIALSFNQNEFTSMTQRDIKEMTFRSQLLTFPQYKNPTAYVVGYSILDNGRISKEKLDKITPHFEKFDYPIRPPDAVRYANLWINELLLS